MDPSKFSGILAKYKAIKTRAEDNERKRQHRDYEFDSPAPKAAKTDLQQPEPEVTQAQGLEPLPQPEEIIEEKHLKLMEWVSEPTYIDIDQTMPFRDLGISAVLTDRLEQLGYKDAFAVQTAIIPAVLEAQASNSPIPLPDILVNSYTGSGKTLAYCVPIVEKLLKCVVRRTRALILVPTRPLLTQVVQTLSELTEGTSIQTLALRSDNAFKKESYSLRHGTFNILVATPGRLVDHLTERPDLLQDLEFLVVDEADRLLAQTFQDWTTALAKAVPLQVRPIGLQQWSRPPQRLVFSATLTRDPGKLASLQVSHIPTGPQIFVVGSASTREFIVPAGLDEVLLRIENSGDKPLAAAKYLNDSNKIDKTIVFVRSNEAAARLARLLELVFARVFKTSVNCQRCSGELSVSERNAALEAFAEGKIQILVCTDLIARGIDVKDIGCVLNYDLPMGAREYIHRVGRTARAGTEGIAATVATSSAERKHYWKIQNQVTRAKKIPVVEMEVEPGSEYEEALKELEREVHERVE